MAQGLTPYQTLMAARLWASRRMPYYTSAIYLLIPREHKLPKGPDGRGSAMGVTENGFLLWDVEEVGKRTVEQVGTTILHEVGHWTRGHLGRFKLLTQPDEMLPVWNIAGDCEINDDLAAVHGLSPMPGWFFPKTIGAKDGLIAEEYFALLKKNVVKIDMGNMGDGHGQCGSCAGHAVPDEPKSGGNRGAGKGSEDKKEEKDKATGGEGDGQEEGGDPDDENAGRSPREVQAMRRQVADEVRNAAAKGRGTVPAGLARWANAMFEPPHVPWQQKLAKAIRSAVSYRAGMVDYRYERPSRRSAAVGHGIVLPCMRSPVPAVAVAIDTSGSMGYNDLGECLRETAGVLKACGAPVTFLSCDADVHEVKQASTVQEVAKALKGGGGTSFLPVFEALPRLKVKPNILVYCTDGDGDWDRCTQPRGVNVIWVVTRNKHDAPFGETIHVD